MVWLATSGATLLATPQPAMAKPGLIAQFSNPVMQFVLYPDDELLDTVPTGQNNVAVLKPPIQDARKVLQSICQLTHFTI